MHFTFKQAVCLKGKDYTRGVHDLSESVLESLSDDETFLKYCELKLIEEKVHHIAPVVSLAEKNKKIAEKILGSKKSESETPVGSTSENKEGGSDNAEASSEEAKELSGKGKNKNKKG